MIRFIFISLFLFSFANFLASQDRFVGDGLFEIFANSVQKRIGKSQFEIESINAYNRNQQRITKINVLKLDSTINYDVNNNPTYKKVFFYNHLGQNTRLIRYRTPSADSLGISAFAIQYFQYDSNGYCTNVRFHIVDRQKRKGVIALDFKYNTDGLLRSRITKSKRDTTAWENISKITIRYTSSKQILQTTNYFWEDSIWAPKSRFEYYYDSLGNILSKVLLVDNNGWIKRVSWYKSYNSQNKITSSYRVHFSNDSLSKSDTANITHYYYDNNGALIKDIRYSTRGTMHHYYNDASGNLIFKNTYVRALKTEEWKIFSQNEYSHDDYNNKIEELLFYIKMENGKKVKELGDKTQFVVDTTQNSDSTIIFPFLFFGPKGSPYLMKKEFYSGDQDGEWNNPYVERYYYSKFLFKSK